MNYEILSYLLLYLCCYFCFGNQNFEIGIRFWSYEKCKFIVDKKSRLALRGRNLKAKAKLYALDTDGEFTEISLGKVNRRFKKQLLGDGIEVPENTLYLIYCTSQSGLSFIEI